MTAAVDVGELFSQHAGAIGCLIRRLVGDGAHVDDILQQTFLVAHRRSEKFEGRSSPKTWLCGIAVNLCRHHRRSLGRWLNLRDRVRGEPIEQPPAPIDTVARKQSIARVNEALAVLPGHQREVLVLYELEGVSGKEIAEILGLPLDTVWTRLHRARKRFSRHLRALRAKGVV